MISTMNNNTTAACGSTLEERVAALEADGPVLQALHEKVAGLQAALEAGVGKGKAAPKAKAKAKAEKVKVSLSPSDDMGRLSADDINTELCQARICDEELPGYKPKMFKESQCQKAKKVGELCTTCNKAFEKAEEYGDDYQAYKQGHGKWLGLITEDPHPTAHMLGTTWAENKVSKVDEAAEDSESESAAPAPAPVPAPAIMVREIPASAEEMIAVRKELAAMRQELDAVRQELAGIVSKNKVVVEVRLA
jgi:hypothetical protein